MASGMIPLAVFNPVFADIYGVQLAGVFASCILFGITCMQTFIYYVDAPKDSFLIRIMPLWLVVIETVHQMLYCVGIYRAVIRHFGDESIITVIIKEIFISAILQAFITSTCQLFFLYRIWVFSRRHWILPALCIPLILAGWTGTVGDNIIALTETLTEFTTSNVNTGLTYLAHGSNLAVDMIIAIAMVFLLFFERRGHDYKSGHGIIASRFLVLTVNSNLFTAVCALLLIIFVGISLSVQKKVLTYAFFNFIITPLYCNSVLANLNSREYIRGKGAITFTSGNTNMNNLELRTMDEDTKPDDRSQPDGI